MTIDPSKIKTAKEWSKRKLLNPDNDTDGVRVAQVITALPDTIVDGEKLREVINAQLDSHPHGTVGHQVAEDLACKLQDILPTPTLPTLADMTLEERVACQWMQCKVQGIANPRALLNIWDYGCYVVTRHGTVLQEALADVTPLPDLPKLEWPGQEARTEDNPPTETVDNTSQAAQIETLSSLLAGAEKAATDRSEQIKRLQATIRALSYPCAGGLIGLIEKGIITAEDMEDTDD